jgi:hypothetical protein
MNGVKVKELSIIAQNNKSEIHDIIKKNNEFTSNIETKKGENEVLHK